jgi:hypothetical protein
MFSRNKICNYSEWLTITSTFWKVSFMNYKSWRKKQKKTFLKFHFYSFFWWPTGKAKRLWFQTLIEETIFSAPAIWIKTWEQKKSPVNVACVVILPTGGLTMWMVVTYICTKTLWGLSLPRTKSNRKGKMILTIISWPIRF